MKRTRRQSMVASDSFIVFIISACCDIVIRCRASFIVVFISISTWRTCVSRALCKTLKRLPSHYLNYLIPHLNPTYLRIRKMQQSALTFHQPESVKFKAPPTRIRWGSPQIQYTPLNWKRAPVNFSVSLADCDPLGDFSKVRGSSFHHVSADKSPSGRRTEIDLRHPNSLKFIERRRKFSRGDSTEIRPWTCANRGGNPFPCVVAFVLFLDLRLVMRRVA